MLTAKISVGYEDDWTAELGQYDVFGEFLASTFQNRRYIGILVLETDHLEEVLETIEGHEAVDEIEIVERYEVDGGHSAATLLLRGSLTEFSPLQTLLYEGFLPIGPTKLEGGREVFDLLLEDREQLSQATTLLSQFGNVSIERVSREFRQEVVPSAAEWQELLESIPQRQRELLELAVESGYFEIPRESTLADLAAEMDITKTTASNHLRKAERRVFKFLIPYITLAAPLNR